MPLFEYECRSCHARFEELVSGDAKVACPSCGAARPEKLPSAFAVGGGKARETAPMGCGSCGDPRGPGACRLGS